MLSTGERVLKKKKIYFFGVKISILSKLFLGKKKKFNFNSNFINSTLKSEHMRIELFQDSVENSSKKKKKDSLPNKDKLPNLLGFIHLPLNSIESNQPIEKWYRLENSSDLLTTSVSLSSSTNGGSTMNGGEQQINTSSKTTTHDLNKDGKDSILIRVKAKYNCVDILPLTCYNRLIKVNLFNKRRKKTLFLLF